MSSGGDARWYTFMPGDASATLTMTTTSASYDTYLYLVREDCSNNPGVYSVVATNDDGGTGTLSRISTTVYDDYRYYLGVGGYSSRTGTYSMTVSSSGYVAATASCGKLLLDQPC
jgi:hypothetical protein